MFDFGLYEGRGKSVIVPRNNNSTEWLNRNYPKDIKHNNCVVVDDDYVDFIVEDIIKNGMTIALNDIIKLEVKNGHYVW